MKMFFQMKNTFPQSTYSGAIHDLLVSHLRSPILGDKVAST